MCVNFREPRGCGRGPSAARVYLAELRPLTTLETTEGPKKMWLCGLHLSAFMAFEIKTKTFQKY